MQSAVYACRNRDEAIRWQSTSGGVFTLIAEQVLAKRGAVYGVVFDDAWHVAYIRAEKSAELAAMWGSKYLQACVGDALKTIRCDLEEGREILFVGTPCQVQGLRSFLGQDYPSLYCVDFVCLGVGSPGVWNAYLEQCFSKESIREIRFKDKRAGWHRFTTVIRTDKREIAVRGPENPYLGSYLVGCNIRPSCYHCRFKGAQGHAGDLTISDSWGIDSIAPEFDDDKGLSNVFVNTPKGAEMFAAIQTRTEHIAIDFEKAVYGNPYYSKCIEQSPKRALFWEVFHKEGLLKAFHTVAPYSLIRTMVRRVMRLFQLLPGRKRR